MSNSIQVLRMTKQDPFLNKSILITGGTGSFGRHMAHTLLEQDACQKVIIFSRDEWKQWEMRQSAPLFNHPKIRYFLGDVRDTSRMERAFNGVDIVIHAAALKQVPAAEYNPTEFVKTNVNGAINVIDAAINAGVKKVIALSSDKAVNPINLYGATKLCSDKIFVAGNAYVGARGYPNFSVVRYGNVLGSRGSLIPRWLEMIKKGATELPVTDERMTRFWLTFDHAVQFVANCAGHMQGGEIYIPKIPSMKIIDMAEAIAPGIKIKICGVRAGEKIHEMMLNAEDASHGVEYHDSFMILPYLFASDPILRERFLKGREGKPLPEGFAYTSDNNTDWLSKEKLLRLIGTI